MAAMVVLLCSASIDRLIRAAHEPHFCLVLEQQRLAEIFFDGPRDRAPVRGLVAKIVLRGLLRAIRILRGSLAGYPAQQRECPGARRLGGELDVLTRRLKLDVIGDLLGACEEQPGQDEERRSPHTFQCSRQIAAETHYSRLDLAPRECAIVPQEKLDRARPAVEYEIGGPQYIGEIMVDPAEPPRLRYSRDRVAKSGFVACYQSQLHGLGVRARPQR